MDDNSRDRLTLARRFFEPANSSTRKALVAGLVTNGAIWLELIMQATIATVADPCSCESSKAGHGLLPHPKLGECAAFLPADPRRSCR